MKANFDKWLQEILRHEGGYSDHPSDPGGATNYGITRRTLSSWRGENVTKDDVKNITLPEVAAIYKAKYWDAVQADHLPSGLDLVAFDAAVNSGPSRGAKWLQEAIYATVDGQIGPKTIAAAKDANPQDAIARACELRMHFLRQLPTWGTFGKGWSKRVDGVRITAMQATKAPTGHATAPQPIPAPIQPKAPATHAGAIAAAFAAGLAAIYLWITKG